MKRRQAIKLYSVGIVGATSTLTASCAVKKYSFDHGVASGDPLENSVILWTRITPFQSGPIDAEIEVARDASFSKVIFTKKLQTSSLSDYTLKYDFDIKGYLKNGEVFYYRFKAGAATSQVGKTRTLDADASKIKIGVFSCSNYPAGYFNAYHAAALQDDIDVWLHLGDYLYEYPMGGYATDNAEALNRMPEPSHEMVTLADYRTRHAQYKQDIGAQALHGNSPVIAVWDDHEFANDAWKKGAQNHSSDGIEGDFYARRSAAIKAYYEWMPIREQSNKRKIYREFKIGKLIHLLMLDTRQYERVEQIHPADFLQDKEFKREDFFAALDDPKRDLIGSEQMSWIKKRINSSDAKWTIFGQQVLMTKVKFPKLSSIMAKEDIPAFLKPYIRFEDYNLPSNLDAWDGYPAERNRLYQMMEDSNKPFISLAGDTHNSWMSTLQNDKQEVVGVEVGAPSVSSPGITDAVKVDEKLMAEDLVSRNRELLWMDPSRRGFVTLECNDIEVLATFHFIEEMQTINPAIASTNQFLIDGSSKKITKVL